MRSLSVLVLFSLLVAVIHPQNPAVAQISETANAKVETAGGLHTATFETVTGRVIVNLPDDTAAGDTISGSVIVQPTGKTEQEREEHAAELQGFVVEIEDRKVEAKDGKVKWAVPAALAGAAAVLILKDRSGKEIGRTKVPVNPQQERQSGGVRGIDIVTHLPYQIPSSAQAGRPLQIVGPCDGDSENTKVQIGGKPAEFLAESPRKAIVRTPRDVVGLTQIEFRERDVTIKRPIRVVSVSLKVGKTTLRSGEKTTLTVEARGLEDLRAPARLQLRNATPNTIRLEKGDDQTVEIRPEEVRGGQYSYTQGLTSLAPGAFSVSATLTTQEKFNPIEEQGTQSTPQRPTGVAQRTPDISSDKRAAKPPRQPQLDAEQVRFLFLYREGSIEPDSVKRTADSLDLTIKQTSSGHVVGPKSGHAKVGKGKPNSPTKPILTVGDIEEAFRGAGYGAKLTKADAARINPETPIEDLFKEGNSVVGFNINTKENAVQLFELPIKLQGDTAKGIEKKDIRRGMVIAKPGSISPHRLIVFTFNQTPETLEEFKEVFCRMYHNDCRGPIGEPTPLPDIVNVERYGTLPKVFRRVVVLYDEEETRDKEVEVLARSVNPGTIVSIIAELKKNDAARGVGEPQDRSRRAVGTGAPSGTGVSPIFVGATFVGSTSAKQIPCPPPDCGCGPNTPNIHGCSCGLLKEFCYCPLCYDPVKLTPFPDSIPPIKMPGGRVAAPGTGQAGDAGRSETVVIVLGASLKKKMCRADWWARNRKWFEKEIWTQVLASPTAEYLTIKTKSSPP